MYLSLLHLQAGRYCALAPPLGAWIHFVRSCEPQNEWGCTPHHAVVLDTATMTSHLIFWASGEQREWVREIREKSVISHHRRRNGRDDRRPCFGNNADETSVLILTECIVEEWGNPELENQQRYQIQARNQITSEHHTPRWQVITTRKVTRRTLILGWEHGLIYPTHRHIEKIPI
jgi:hypothetical protein